MAEPRSNVSAWRSVRRLEEVLPGRDNNLNLLRMIAACAVLVSHAYPIALGLQAVEPLYVSTGQTLGHYAVAVFFGISGLLIARSFDRRRSLLQFCVARVMRLYPALVAVLVLTVIAGMAVTRLPVGNYLAQRGTWSYVPANLSLAFLQFPLPGIFERNPYGPAINGSLWTLFYEVFCYGCVVVVGLLGLLSRRYLFMIVTAVIIAGHVLSVGHQPGGGMAYRIHNLAELGFPFALGTAAYVWRHRVPMHGAIAVVIWVMCLPFAGTAYMPSAIMVAIVYSALWFGYIPKGPLLAYNRVGDFSYGTYIYAFPVQQTLVYFWPGQGPILNMVLALPLTLVLAWFSWHFIERTALARSQPLGDALARRLFRRSRTEEATNAGA